MAPRAIRRAPITRTVTAEMVVPQRASFRVAADDPSPTTTRATLVPMPNASSVNAPPRGVAAPSAFISAAYTSPQGKKPISVPSVNLLPADGDDISFPAGRKSREGSANPRHSFMPGDNPSKTKPAITMATPATIAA